MNENNFIKDIGRSYIVSSYLPTVLFVAVGIFIFKGFLPTLLLSRILQHDKYYAGQWLIFLAFTGWLSFGLYSTTYSTIQLFEGYYFPEPIKNILRARLLEKLQTKKENLKKILEISKKKQEGLILSPEELMDFGDLQEKAKYEYLNYELEAPIDDENLLSTRLGNVLRACELYPQEKYSLPHGLGWTRLLQLLPKPLKEQIEEKFNQMSFVLNSSLLCYGIGLLAALLGLIRIPCQFLTNAFICSTPRHPNFFQRGYMYASPIEYLAIGLLFIALAYFIYRLSIPIAQDFGALVRASFDLHRFDLLRKLHQPLPDNIEQEKGFWQKLTEYWVAEGRLGFEAPNITYAIKTDLLDYQTEKGKAKKASGVKRKKAKKQ